MAEQNVSQRMHSSREKTLMAYKWLASFVHREWTLDEYPVRTGLNGEGSRTGED
jgi:hypothetical protein